MGRKTTRAILVACALVTGACSSDDKRTTTTASAAPNSSSTASPTTSTAAPTTAPTAAPTTAPPTTEAAAATTEESAVPASGKSFSINIAEPSSLDPAMASEIEGSQVLRLLFQTLVTLDPDLIVVPGVATDWSVASDGITWTFNLAEEAAFSDGNPVTAEDFAYGFARAADPDLESPSAYQGLPIVGWADVNGAEPSGKVGDVAVSGVAAVDDHTLQIVTDGPFGLLPKLMTYPIFAPVAKSTIDGDQAEAFAEQPIGNGPYKMKGDWQHDDSITVIRNDEYLGTPGIADEIEFKIYNDNEVSYADFQAGELDIVRGVPANELVAAKSEYGDRFLATETSALFYIGMPTQLAPFDNVDFRTALSLAVDRDEIADGVLHGSQTAAVGVVPSQVPGATTDPCDACTFDPERAKELFTKGGGTPGMTITLYDISDDGQEILEPIIKSWHDLLGIDVVVESYVFDEYLDKVLGGVATGPFELGWAWDYPSGYSMLAPLYETSSDANEFAYSNAEFDALMAQVRAAPDEASALPFLTEAEEIVNVDLPVIPVLFGNDIGVHSERVSAVQVDTGALWRLELVEVEA